MPTAKICCVGPAHSGYTYPKCISILMLLHSTSLLYWNYQKATKVSRGESTYATIYILTNNGSSGAEGSDVIEHDVLRSGIEGGLAKQTVVQSSCTRTHGEKVRECCDTTGVVLALEMITHWL